MQGIWLENGQIELKHDLLRPKPQQDEALIRTRLAGICGTDIQLLKGYYNFIGTPGHEFVGDVIEAPNNPGLIGQRVVGEININCGICSLCKQGEIRHCKNRDVLGIRNRNGVFAEYFTLPIQNLHLIPEDVADEDAVFVEPLAAAFRITEQIQIEPTTQVLILGAGKLGQLISMVLKLYSADISVLIRYEKQKSLLEQQNIHTITEQQLENREWDVIVEATGSPSGLSTALQHIKPKGTIVLKSTYADNIPINASQLVVNEINVIGSRCGPFEPVLEILRKKSLSPNKLVEASYTLEDAKMAFEHSQKQGAQKILVDFR